MVNKLLSLSAAGLCAYRFEILIICEKYIILTGLGLTFAANEI